QRCRVLPLGCFATLAMTEAKNGTSQPSLRAKGEANQGLTCCLYFASRHLQ
ncbi:MAG: hypothetical protein RIQ68_129, partial [Pseudomonadota bacterium]